MASTLAKLRLHGLDADSAAARVVEEGLVPLGRPGTIIVEAANLRVEAAIGAVRAGPYMSLMPAFTALLAVVFLDESLELYHLAGTAVIAAGLLLSGRRPGARLPA